MIGVGLGATAVAAMEQGQIDAAVMLDPSVTVLQRQATRTSRFSSDTRTQKDTQAVFGGDYPGGALYTKADWIEKHPKETQGMTTAIVNTLNWIHSHTPEEVMAKMPAELVGTDKAGYLAALEEHDSDVFDHRQDGPEGRRRGAGGVQPVLARRRQGQYRRDARPTPTNTSRRPARHGMK